MKKFLIATAAAMLTIGVLGGASQVSAQTDDTTTTTVDAGAYPPPPPPPPPSTTTTTVAISVQPPPGQLPRTGAGIDQPLLVGLAALVFGGGLVLVARQRRRADEV